MSNVCDTNDPTKFVDTPESTSDWVAPFTDTDPLDFWCTKRNTVKGATLNPFECSSLRCFVERKLDTGDAIKDLKLSPKPGVPDYMVIRPNRANLFINKATTQFAFAASNAFTATSIELSVPTGASQLIASTLAAAGLALATLAF